MTKANDYEVGGSHYKQPDGGEEHWDRVHRLGLDYFQANITKYVERWKLKNGIEDLHKARHYLDKYLELVDKWNEADKEIRARADARKNFPDSDEAQAHERMEHPHVVDWGTRVKPSGWVGYEFEGMDGDGQLMRCQVCLEHFRTPIHADPNEHHACGGHVPLPHVEEDPAGAVHRMIGTDPTGSPMGPMAGHV